MPAPKIKLFYFKHVVDACFYSFFDDYNDCFARNDYGQYVFSRNVSRMSMARYFTMKAKDEITKYVRPFDLFSPEYMFVIGGCAPADNMLLEYRGRNFPAKLDKTIENGGIKYVLKEKDILIDQSEFNSVIDDVFENMFAEKGMTRLLGPEYGNVFAIRHRRLDCYSMFKTLKYVFGRSNCVNVWTELAENRRSCVTAVNDLIDMYVNNKTAMNKSPEFKRIVAEIRQYAEGRVGGVNNLV